MTTIPVQFLNAAFEVFSVVTKNRCHLRHHISQKTQKYLYSGKTINKNFLQLRCSNLLLHLKYKVLFCMLKIKFKKVAGGKALATDHRARYEIFFDNLIFSIIAQMFCGNHLNSLTLIVIDPK